MAGKSKYYQVKEQIEDMIARGELHVGDELPSEPKLAEMFNFNRGTVRQALSILAKDGIIARRSGFRTMIVRMPDEKEAHIISFAKQIEAGGMKPKTRVLLQQKMLASEAGGRICKAFSLDAESAATAEVYCIRRLRCGGERPLALQTIYLLARDFKPDLLEKEDFTQSVFDLYARYQRQVTWASESIRARPAEPEEVKLLEMSDVPKLQRFVYVRDRISYDQDNRPLEVMTAIDRGDVFKAYQYRIIEENHRLIGPNTT
jgi:DNA-binding GntR family transcriptional regulator